MENNKILIEINAEEITKMIKNEPEVFIGETLKDVLLKSIKKEYEEKTGEKYKRETDYQRWSSNPGSVNINNEKVKIEVPRIEQNMNRVKNYEKLHLLKMRLNLY